MARQQEQGSSSIPTLEEISSAARSSIKDETQSASRAFSETSADLSAKVSGLAGDAKEAVIDKVEGAKDGFSDSLKAFGGALRTAGDQLAQDQPAASKMVMEAAAGLDTLSASLGSKPVGEVINDLRNMGRSNVGGLFAGSVFAGLALGRFLRSSESSVSAGDSPSEGERQDTWQDGSSNPADNVGTGAGL